MDTPFNPKFRPGEPLSAADLRRMARLTDRLHRVSGQDTGYGSSGIAVIRPDDPPLLRARITGLNDSMGSSLPGWWYDWVEVELNENGDWQARAGGLSGDFDTEPAVEANLNQGVPAHPDTGPVVLLRRGDAYSAATTGRFWVFDYPITYLPPNAPPNNSTVIINVVNIQNFTTFISNQFYYNIYDGNIYININNTWVVLCPCDVIPGPGPSYSGSGGGFGYGGSQSMRGTPCCGTGLPATLYAFVGTQSGGEAGPFAYPDPTPLLYQNPTVPGVETWLSACYPADGCYGRLALVCYGAPHPLAGRVSLGGVAKLPDVCDPFFTTFTGASLSGQTGSDCQSGAPCNTLNTATVIVTE